MSVCLSVCLSACLPVSLFIEIRKIDRRNYENNLGKKETEINNYRHSGACPAASGDERSVGVYLPSPLILYLPALGGCV